MPRLMRELELIREFGPVWGDAQTRGDDPDIARAEREGLIVGLEPIGTGYQLTEAGLELLKSWKEMQTRNLLREAGK